MKNEHSPQSVDKCVHFINGRWYVAHRDQAGCFWSYRKKDSGLWRGDGSNKNAVPDAWGYSYVNKCTAVKRAIELYNIT